jgi:hypothetical protein
MCGTDLMKTSSQVILGVSTTHVSILHFFFYRDPRHRAATGLPDFFEQHKKLKESKKCIFELFGKLPIIPLSLCYCKQSVKVLQNWYFLYANILSGNTGVRGLTVIVESSKSARC